MNENQDTEQKRVDFGTSQHWKEALQDSFSAFEDYHSKCDSIAKLYATLKGGESTEREFKIFWSNIEVLKPSVYARPPVPVVVPRFKDLKELPRTASEMLERTLITNFELQDLDYTMKMARDDYLLFGRGILWNRYKSEGGEPTVSSDDAKVDFSESAIVEHVSRRDFRHDPARKWSEVGWVAKRSYLTKPKFIARFGQQFASVEAKKVKDNDDEAYGEAKVEVWEIWDKTTKKVIWVSPASEVILDMRPPHLQLEGFFPCPRPCYGSLVENTLIPVPDFVYYKDQVEEINELTARISKLSEALKMKGFYAAGESELKDAIEAAIANESNSAVLVPVSNMAALGGKSLKDSIVWLPVQEVAGIIQVLIGQRKQLVQDVYEITGISDIVRGATDPNETASAQKIKAQWGSVRIRERQGELARLSRDTTRIMAEIMAENYQQQTFVHMSQMDVQTDEAVQQQVQQIQHGAQRHIQQLQQQAPQQMPQQGQGPQQPPQPQPEQIMQQVQAKVAELQKTVTFEKVISLFRSQKARAFLIEIEVDSTIQPDEDAEKQRRTEFLTSVGGFVSQILPMVQSVPQTGEFAAEALKFAVGGFRAGRQLEGVIEEMSDKLKQLSKKPQQEGPTPEQIEQAVAKSVEGKRVEVEAIKAKGAADKAQLELLKVQREMNTPPPATPPVDNRPQIAANNLKQQELAMKERVEKQKIAANIEVKRIEIAAQAAMKTTESQQAQTLEAIPQEPTPDPMAAVAPMLERLTQMVEELTAAQTAPKQVVRDGAGNVVGIETARRG